MPDFPLLKMTQSEEADTYMQRGTKEKGETLVASRCLLRFGIAQSVSTGCAWVESQKSNDRAKLSFVACEVSLTTPMLVNAKRCWERGKL